MLRFEGVKNEVCDRMHLQLIVCDGVKSSQKGRRFSWQRSMVNVIVVSAPALQSDQRIKNDYTNIVENAQNHVSMPTNPKKYALAHSIINYIATFANC